MEFFLNFRKNFKSHETGSHSSSALATACQLRNVQSAAYNVHEQSVQQLFDSADALLLARCTCLAHLSAGQEYRDAYNRHHTFPRVPIHITLIVVPTRLCAGPAAVHAVHVTDLKRHQFFRCQSDAVCR